MTAVKWLLAPSGIILFWIICLFMSLVLGAPSSFKDLTRLWSSRTLYCGRESLQFTLPANHSEIIHFLTVLDSEGQPHPLGRSACVSISRTPEGSTVVIVPYIGCFFIKKNSYFLMTLRIEGLEVLQSCKVLLYEEDLKCPTHLPALDVPSSSVCLGVRRQDRLPCSPQPVSQGEWEERGCCYTPEDHHIPCYYGNAVTTHCTPDGYFSIAVSGDVTLPPLILDSVHLVSGYGSGCVPVTKNGAFVLYKFPLSSRGTTFLGADDQGIYANELVAHHDVKNWNTGSVMQDSSFRLHVSCRYSTGSFLPLMVQLFTLPPPPSITQFGPLSLELRIATDQQYSEYYANGDYPLVKLLRDSVFQEVRILQQTDPDLVLVLHKCWATRSTNPLQRPQWPILMNRCPYEGDNYQTRFILVGAVSGLQFPSHYQRFVISTFTFADSASQQALTGPVYFHCSAAACVPSTVESCMAHCPRMRARRSPENQALQGTPRSLVMAEGPVDFQMEKEHDNVEQKGSHWSRPILSKEWERALVVAVGAVFVALSLVGLRKYRKMAKM